MTLLSPNMSHNIHSYSIQPSGNLPDGVYLRDTVPFEIRGFSLPLVVFSIGVVLTGSSFAGFFLNDGGGDGAISSLGFVYGALLTSSVFHNFFRLLSLASSVVTR